jgi:hypothetical protein
MDKVFDDDYEFPGLGKPTVCRLRVYRETGGKGPLVAVATEIPRSAASITNAIEWLAGRVWTDFQPDSGWPPILFDHWQTDSYADTYLDRPRGDEFSWVSFASVRADKQVVSGPEWRWWPGVMVRRLVDDPTLGDGFDRNTDPADPGADWTEQEVDR